MEMVCTVHALEMLHWSREDSFEVERQTFSIECEIKRFGYTDGTFIVVDQKLYSAAIIISLEIHSQLNLIATQCTRRIIGIR